MWYVIIILIDLFINHKLYQVICWRNIVTGIQWLILNYSYRHMIVYYISGRWWYYTICIWSDVVYICMYITSIWWYLLHIYIYAYDRIYCTYIVLFQAYGGLRGAVAFSLVSMLTGKLDQKIQSMFMTTTLIVIIFTVFVQVCMLITVLELTFLAILSEAHPPNFQGLKIGPHNAVGLI